MVASSASRKRFCRTAFAEPMGPEFHRRWPDRVSPRPPPRQRLHAFAPEQLIAAVLIEEAVQRGQETKGGGVKNLRRAALDRPEDFNAREDVQFVDGRGEGHEMLPLFRPKPPPP